MIHDPQHTLTGLAVHEGYRLTLSFADGLVSDIDLTEWIATTRALAALRDTTLFASARLDARGGYAIWIEDDLELAADNLRNLAVEQSGGIGNERIFNWMADNGLTQTQAAEAIGISRRMLNYYLSAAKPIPQTVWLACVGWASLHKKRAHAGKRAAALGVAIGHPG